MSKRFESESMDLDQMRGKRSSSRFKKV